jgi:hypothetical protein
VYDGSVVRAAVLALLLAACSQGGSRRARPGEDPGGETIDPRCEAVRARVRSLYQKQEAPLIDDDVTMVMNDCREDPERVAPCAERAASAAEIESTCLIPLDDEGAVDGDRLKGR